MSIGKRIKDLRNRLGMSQVSLADAIDVSKQTLYKYENEIITNIPSDKIEALAKALHTTPAYIMGWGIDVESPIKIDVRSVTQDEYYLKTETAAIAQELFDNPDYRMLFDAAKDSKPEDIKMVADMLTRLKQTNPDG